MSKHYLLVAGALMTAVVSVDCANGGNQDSSGASGVPAGPGGSSSSGGISGSASSGGSSGGGVGLNGSPSSEDAGGVVDVVDAAGDDGSFIVSGSDDATTTNDGSTAGTSGSSSGSTSSSGSGGSSGAPRAVQTDGGKVTYACTRSIYVATSGSDSNSGAAASPLKTISKATANTKSGDCVLVRAGTYAESSTIGFSQDGTASAPIVLQSVDGPLAAIIDASGNLTGETVLIRNNYIIVDGFEFINSPTNTSQQVVHFDGLNQGKGPGSVLRNCKVTGGFDHLKINEACQGVTIENNEFYGTFGHIPISLTGAPGLVFRGNYGHDWNTGGNDAVQFKGGSHDAVFDGNRFENITSQAGTIALGDGCDSTCDIDPNHYAAAHVIAVNNVMVHVARGFDVQGCNSCAMLGNTIVDSGQSNVIFKLTSATTNGVTQDTVNARILDNLVSNSGGDQGSVIQVNGSSGQGLQMDYNLAYNGSSAISWGSGHPSTADTHSIEKDPLFVAASSGNYALAAGSPAIKAGTNLYSDYTDDFNGAARPATGPFDIGAFQSP